MSSPHLGAFPGSLFSAFRHCSVEIRRVVQVDKIIKLFLGDENMNSVIEKILNDIAKNNSAIFELSGKTEKDITEQLFKLLGWNIEARIYDGLFGHGSFKTDKCMRINNELSVFEVKIVKEKLEWGYWHALVQGLIYSYQQRAVSSEQNFLVLCIILDWGRGAGRELNDHERGFLDQFRKDRIYFLRVSFIRFAKCGPF